jgi:hypothetical protein
MDLSAWKEREIKVSLLTLDPLNPRIPGISDRPSTRDVVAALIGHEDVFKLAKSIVEFGGLYPSESLIAIEENGDKIVVEGNRRLAALKLLDSPDIAPNKDIERFRHLKNKIAPQLIEKVKVVFAPSREAAAPLIVARHTTNVVQPWTPAQQAKYIRTLVKPGHTIEDVAKEIGMTRGEILENIKTDTMIRVAQVMPLTQEARDIVQDPHRFSVSALERVIQSSPGQKFLGIKFDADGGLVGEIEESEFKRGYTRVLNDIANGIIDTRRLNSKKDIEDYFSTFGSDIPNRKKPGVFTSSSLLSGKTQAANAARKAATKSIRGLVVPKDSAYLIPKDFRCGLRNPRIKEVFLELRRLKVGDFPNACAVLLRILLELVSGHYLDVTGKISPLLQAAQQQGKKSDWYPPLRHLLDAILKDQDIQLKPLARKALNRMLSDDYHLLSLEQMNQFFHNRYVAPTERDLRKMWDVIEPLLEQLMKEPPPARPNPKP